VSATGEEDRAASLVSQPQVSLTRHPTEAGPALACGIDQGGLTS
jgi:hypothetical protein